MLVKLKTAYAHKGETLCAGDIIAVDSILADSLFLKGYAAFAEDDEEDYSYEHSPLLVQPLADLGDVDPQNEQDFSEGEEPPESTAITEGDSMQSPIDEPPQDVEQSQEIPQEAETVPLGRSGKAERNVKNG